MGGSDGARTARGENAVGGEDMAKAREWFSRLFASADALPISFTLDGRAIAGLPEEWSPVATQRRIDANIHETTFEGADPETGLTVRVEVTRYHDYPVYEWVAWFANTGAGPTPVVSDILAMDTVVSGAEPVLWHSNGDFYSETGYAPTETPVPAGEVLRFAPNGGRPCDGAFPYFRVMFRNCGLTLAVGWPGQWMAEFVGQDKGVRVRAGQEETAIRLMPGESIRTPRMTALSWTGDESRAVNVWRRWYIAHVLPRPNGQPMRPLVAYSGPDEGEEFTAATEENQIRYIRKAARLGIPFDVWWIDAGWYPCWNDERERKWWITGTWEPDPERFPNGMKAVSDAAAAEGADLLVWFEPERVRRGTKLDVEHPEWLLRADEGGDGLLFLGKPECRQWLTDHVCKLIADNGIRIYRQDHNFEPLLHWRKNDAPDRRGMNENLHVQGYLQYWDDLLARNPGLWIDSCASGGRRNDLETMRRSVPLHYTDFGYGNHPVKLAFHRTLFEWIPYFKEPTLSWDVDEPDRFCGAVDSFSFHCAFAAMLSPAMDIRRDDYDYATAVRMIAIWRKASNLLLYGDYYEHTPYHKRADAWVAWQFDAPETGRGFLQAIRFQEAPEESITIRPAGIDRGAAYVFENDETGERREVMGSLLARDGFVIRLPKRSGAVWFYRRKA